MLYLDPSVTIYLSEANCNDELYLSPVRTLTKRDCNHIHGSGQPVLPTLDSSGGSIHSHS
jgi:hypothetical protein